MLMEFLVFSSELNSGNSHCSQCGEVPALFIFFLGCTCCQVSSSGFELRTCASQSCRFASLTFPWHTFSLTSMISLYNVDGDDEDVVHVDDDVLLVDILEVLMEGLL